MKSRGKADGETGGKEAEMMVPQDEEEQKITSIDGMKMHR
jgi:hypothetical protein